MILQRLQQRGRERGPDPGLSLTPPLRRCFTAVRASTARCRYAAPFKKLATNSTCAGTFNAGA